MSGALFRAFLGLSVGFLAACGYGCGGRRREHSGASRRYKNRGARPCLPFKLDTKCKDNTSAQFSDLYITSCLFYFNNW